MKGDAIMTNSISMDSKMSSYRKLFVIPQDPEDRRFLQAVDRKTMVDVENIYGSFIDYDWQANTITNCLVETFISTLAFMLESGAASNGVGIKFYDILQLAVSIKTNDKAEKEGNINIYFKPGEKIESLITDGPQEYSNVKISAQERFTVKDPEEELFYSQLDKNARYRLNIEHGIVLLDHLKYTVFAIAYTFFENLYCEILYRLSNLGDDSEEKLISVNFNDNIEIHGTLDENGNARITMRPGMNAKLLIKCDKVTENTMGDEF